MLMLYNYLISKDLRVIFISNKKKKYKKLIELNLKLFDVNDYLLLLRSSTSERLKFKADCVSKISHRYHIIAILNDQNDIIYPNIVKFPALFKAE